MRLLLGSLLCCFALACGPTRPTRPRTDGGLVGKKPDGGGGQPVAGTGGSGGTGGAIVSPGTGGSPPPAPEPTPAPVTPPPDPGPAPKLDAAAPQPPRRRDAAAKMDTNVDPPPDVGGGGGGGGGADDKALLYVIGSMNAFISDTNLLDHLKDRGFTVTVKTDMEVRDTDADGKAAVLLSGSTALAATMASFPQLPGLKTPVVVMDENLEPFLNMVGNNDNEHGTTQATQVSIPGNAEGDLTGGLKGNVTVYSAQFAVSFGVPAAAALRGATVAGNNNQLALFAYKAGAKMANNATAPARRVFFFMRDSATANLLTGDGFKLFDAAIAFATAK
jgi:hypothetical protein